MTMSNYRNKLITTAEERAAYIEQVQKNAEKHGLFFTIMLGEASAMCEAFAAVDTKSCKNQR